MKSARFRYFAPHTIAEAVQLLDEQGDEARLLAGGQSLLPLLNLRLARPSALIDLNEIQALAFIHPRNGGLVLGALTRDATLERDPLVAARQPLLVEAAHYVGHPAIRHRSTLGGSLAHADPAAELPAVMLALDAAFTLQSSTGSRTIAAAAFFKGPFQTALQHGEILTEVHLPGLPPRSGSAFLEFARREGDYALAGVAAVICLAEDGTIAQARLTLCSVAPTPLQATTAEALLRGRHPDDAAWQAAAEAVVNELKEPPADIHGSADYRRHLAGVLTRRALALAAQRAERSHS
ncbi:FAD binding domain-containing protein [Thermogemmatispora carboxidivorans]|uniref:FAD binding domain-containing protein n=1 Tax=Thermogemmatispora carboxidivorans TaxID=1382306 RepID=UPI00069C4188|nr:xanthine dehydrogenase family protein subunit M [Thermogemmatispora carboxidivorans]